MQPEAARPILHTYSIGDESSYNEVDTKDIYILDPVRKTKVEIRIQCKTRNKH